MKAFSRAELLIGEEKLNILKNSRVAVFGVGGVGGFIVEALARCGVGKIDIFDNDTVDESNINRQIIADFSCLGKDKVSVFKDRLEKINPEIKVNAHQTFFMPENSNEFDFSDFDYIVDAVDTVTAKIEIIRKAKEVGKPVITCMGTGGKTDVTLLKISDISKTSVCPLARVMRKELKDRGISAVKTLYSIEEPKKPLVEEKAGKKNAQPTLIFVPATAGLMIAREVVLDLVGGI